MKIDKKMIDKLLLLNDDQLWRIIKSTADKSGVDSLKTIKRPEDMSSLRERLKGFDQNDLNKAIDILNGGNKNG